MEEELFPRTLAGPRFALLLPVFPLLPRKGCAGISLLGGEAVRWEGFWGAARSWEPLGKGMVTCPTCHHVGSGTTSPMVPQAPIARWGSCGTLQNSCNPILRALPS